MDADSYAAEAIARGGSAYGVRMDALTPPSGPMSEAVFMQAIIDLAKRNGWDYHHQTVSKRSKEGWPDLPLWRPGQFLIREIKTETGQLTPAQLTCLESLRAAGVDAGVWRPSDWKLIVDTLTGKVR